MNKFKKFLIVYFFFCFSFLVFFASGFVDSQDGLQYLAIARRLYYDHTFEMPEESFDTGEKIYMSLTLPVDGKYYSPTGLGFSLSLLPAVFVEDVFLRISATQPISAFPLKNDWPVLLFASMTNAFWGALLASSLYLYMKILKLSHKSALYLSFFFVIGTNIFVYTKHSFAHMMFVSLMTLSFYQLKKFSFTNKAKDIVLSGIFMGGVVITYNPTFLFVLPAFAIYYLLVTTWKLSKKHIQKICLDIGAFSLGFLPFLFLYLAFNSLRLGGSGTTAYGAGSLDLPSFPQTYVIVEGIWGLLLSPGKSIFIYSPILLILILFWFKIKKDIYPELIAGLVLFFTYLWFIGTLLGGPDYLVWHGDSSWGPRYVLPILPLLLLVIVSIFRQLSKKQKYFVFYPLLFFGFGINFLSIVLPYQIRFAGLDVDAFFNSRNYNVYQYGNELPRYMPALKMSKTLFKRVKGIKRTYDHGQYNLRFIDGFDYPFDLGWAVWRGMQPYSVATFDNPQNNKIEKIAIQVRNHQMDNQSTASAQLEFNLNGRTVLSQTILPDSESELLIPFSNDMLKQENNILSISTSFVGTSSASLKKKQVTFLQFFRINDLPQNLQTLDFPYVSPISKGLFDLDYYFWGERETDPWSIWHMHSGVYEQTFDLWWVRPLHYWDYPKTFFAILFLIDVGGIIFFATKTLKYSGKE